MAPVQDPMKKRKIVILGARSVGKSSLVKQFIEYHFIDAYYPTIEGNIMKIIAYNGLEYDCHIIDTAGQDEYTPLAERYAIGIHGYIIVYSITSRESFRMAQIIYRKILDFTGLTQVPCVLVGSKLDLQESREVSRWEVEAFASRHTCAWVEISAKTDGHLIGQAFQLCLQQVEDLNLRTRQGPSRNVTFLSRLRPPVVPIPDKMGNLSSYGDDFPRSGRLPPCKSCRESNLECYPLGSSMPQTSRCEHCRDLDLDCSLTASTSLEINHGNTGTTNPLPKTGLKGFSIPTPSNAAQIHRQNVSRSYPDFPRQELHSPLDSRVLKQLSEPTRSLRTAQEITTSKLHGPMQNNALHKRRYPPLDAATGARAGTHQKLRTESIQNTETRRAKLQVPTSLKIDFAPSSDSSEGIFEIDLPEQRESTKDIFYRTKLLTPFLKASDDEDIFKMDLSVDRVSTQVTRHDLGILPKFKSVFAQHTRSTSMRSVGSVNNDPTSPWAARVTSIPSHLDNRKSRKEWPQSAGKEDINFDAPSSTASSSAAGNELDVETVFSAIRKVMEDLKTDPSQILPADEAAARLHTIFDLVFSSKRSCKTLLKFQGDDAKIVLNSLQWLLDYPQLNSTRRSRLLSALLRLSRKSGLYPECIILKDIVRQDDCAVASGHFGEVWKGKFRDQQVCLKVVKIYKQSDVDHLLKVFAKEAILWSQLSHPNLLPFYGIYYLEDGHGRVCLVSPWMNNGNIKDYLVESPRVDRVLLVSDIAAGVSYLHQKAIVHGDLKGVNILVTESGKACLADFGLSIHVDAEMLRWTSESSENTGGTVRWQAPELFDPENENSKPTKEADVYAFSCVCYEIFTCQVPFHEISRESTVMMKVMGGKRPSRPAENSASFIEWGLTDSMWRLMERCWDRDPENRPTMSSISGKDFLSSLVDDRPSGGGEALSPPQFRGAMHGFL